MIKANELRVGNKIIANGLHEGKILTYQRLCVDDTIIFFKEHQTGEYLKDCNPIPLTPEILIKAGFYLAPQRISIYLKRRIQLWMGHNGCIAYLRHEDKDECYYVGDCHYLHQLQNLYFALTQQELEIKL